MFFLFIYFMHTKCLHYIAWFDIFGLSKRKCSAANTKCLKSKTKKLTKKRAKMLERSDRWYEPECYQENECRECDAKYEKLERAADFLKSLVKQLYTNETFDAENFENNLDELCHSLDIRIPMGELLITRKEESKAVKPEKTVSMLNDWTKFNNAYLKQLTI